VVEEQDAIRGLSICCHHIKMVKHQEGQLNYNQETKLNRSTNDITVITEVRGHLGMVNTSGEIVDQPYFHWSINQPLISRLLRVNNPSGFP
jgi:hypothetical protein